MEGVRRPGFAGILQGGGEVADEIGDQTPAQTIRPSARTRTRSEAADDERIPLAQTSAGPSSLEKFAGHAAGGAAPAPFSMPCEIPRALTGMEAKVNPVWDVEDELLDWIPNEREVLPPAMHILGLARSRRERLSPGAMMSSFNASPSAAAPGEAVGVQDMNARPYASAVARAWVQVHGLRPISLLGLSLLRFVVSKCPISSSWT